MYNARLFDDDVTLIEVSYWWREKIPNYVHVFWIDYFSTENYFLLLRTSEFGSLSFLGLIMELHKSNYRGT